MASNNNTIYQTPPLAGRPPFATDDDHLYDKEPQAPAKRLRLPQPEDPNDRTSAYNVYDNYLEGSNRDSGMGSLGKGLMSGNMDDDDPFDDSHRPSTETVRQQPIPLAAPKPGYASPASALNLARPSPAASPEGRQPSPQMSQVPKPLMLVSNLNTRIPPSAAIAVPSTPHPLPPTMTPIKPVFALPNKAEDDRGVKFAAASPILRGNKEETLLPKRGERGDDFWRRFSMVVHQENTKPEKTSAWLRKTQSGSTRLSRWVWIIGMLLLCCIAFGIGIGVWISHNNQSHNGPTALGGSADEKLVSSVAVSTSNTADPAAPTSSSLHVSPTRTVARRDALHTGAIPDPFSTPLAYAARGYEDALHMVVRAHVQPSLQHRRGSGYLNRID